MPDPPLPARVRDDQAVLRALAEARALGLLGPGPVRDHVDHSLRFAVALGGNVAGPVVDLGAGGGVPGLVLARAFPEVRWLFLEASRRRTAFLRHAVAELELGDRVVVLMARAEEAGRDPEHRGGYRTVVSRSFGRPGVVAECAAPLLATGGHLVVSEPPGPSERWPAAGVEAVGLRAIPSRDAGFWVGEQVEPAPDRYPRRVGIPAKRPLF